MTLPATQTAEQPQVIRLPLGMMGKPDLHIRRQVFSFRRAVEAAVVASAGKIGVYRASRVHTAAIALRRHLQVERVLAKAGAPGDKLTHEQWLAYADRSLRFKETVDRSLVGLGLDKEQSEDVWTKLYRDLANPQANGTAPPVAQPAPPASPEPDKKGTSRGQAPDASGAILDASLERPADAGSPVPGETPANG